MRYLSKRRPSGKMGGDMMKDEGGAHSLPFSAYDFGPNPSTLIKAKDMGGRAGAVLPGNPPL